MPVCTLKLDCFTQIGNDCVEAILSMKMIKPINQLIFQKHPSILPGGSRQIATIWKIYISKRAHSHLLENVLLYFLD